MAAPLAAQQTDNYELRALPAEKPVAVDGALEEWDLSGEILVCPDLGKELDTHAVRAAAQYDDDYLYMAFRFVDHTPMINNINPVSDPGGGWRGDGTEIRMLLDNRTIHLQPWYFTEEGRSTLYLRYSPAEDIRLRKDEWVIIPEALDKGARLAFRKHEDGKGYTQEMALPWSLLTVDGRALKAGETMGLGLQVNWGDESGGLLTGGPVRRYEDIVNPENPQRRFFWEAVNAWGTLRFLDHGDVAPSPTVRQADLADQLDAKLYATDGPVPIVYELSADGFATLVIETPDGKRIRNLISDHPRKQGANTDYWDGRDDEGRLVAPGDYRVRGLFHEALDVTYQFHFGTPGPTPWPTPDGRGGWLSNHANHMGAAADDERIYISAPECEGPYPLIALDRNGDKVWGALPRWHAGPLARHGDYLYTVNERDALPARRPGDEAKDSPIELIRLDPATGREAPFSDGNSRHEIAVWNPLREGVNKPWEGWMVEHAAHDADWIGISPQGLAGLDDTLYVALHYQDKLLKVDTETGEVSGEIPLADPSGLASDGKRLLAISGTGVVAIHGDKAHAVPVITNGLSAPVGLAVDTRGAIYVSDWADQMCVKVFSPGGKYLRTIGRPGGRPWEGPYDASGMLLPLGIAVGPEGRLWVAENDFSPRRVSCWDARTGELALERIGRGRYGNMGYYILPDRPEQGIYLNTLLDLDWDTGRWRVTSTLWRSTRENALVGFDPYTRFGRVIQRAGRRFLVHTSKSPHNGITIVSELTADGRAKPLAAAGAVWSALARPDQRFQGGLQPAPLLADNLWTVPELNRAAKEFMPWWFKGPRAGGTAVSSFGAAAVARTAIQKEGWRPPRGVRVVRPNNNMVWSDFNRDGVQDAGEVRFHATPGMHTPVPPFWGPNAWSGGVADDELALYFTAIDEGVAHHYRLPVARWTDDGVPVYDPDQAVQFAASPYMGEAVWVSDEGHVLTKANIPGAGRPNNQRDPLVMFRPDGSIAWTFPSPWTGVHGSHTAPRTKRGRLVGPLGVCGTARLDGVGQIFVFHTNQGTAELFTSDGLYIGRLFADTRGVTQPWPEHPTRGQSINKCTNGGEWFGGQFFQRSDGRSFVVCSRDGGTVGAVEGIESVRRLSDRDITFSAEQYAAAQATARETSAEEAAAQTLEVDALTLRNPATPPPPDTFRWGDTQAAVWRYDATRGARANWGYDADNLYVAFKVQDDTPMINSGEDVRRLFKFGDAAILELRTDPEQTAKQAAPGDLRLLFSVYEGEPVAVLYDYRRPCEGVEPTDFTSVKTTRIDCLRVLDNAKIALERTEKGYTLVASVPLKDLRWTPTPGTSYPGDFGIVYSDKTGQMNVLRMYWANKATGIVSDLSMEADIQPANWGRFDVK
jgi:hypothetical protein